jgi:hypothetical protein
MESWLRGLCYAVGVVERSCMKLRGFKKWRTVELNDAPAPAEGTNRQQAHPF